MKFLLLMVLVHTTSIPGINCAILHENYFSEGTSSSHEFPFKASGTRSNTTTTTGNDGAANNFSSLVVSGSAEVPLNDDGDVAEPLPATLIYEIFPSAEDTIMNSTRCSQTQLSFTKETLLHIWEIKGLLGYISYIKRFDQPFEVKTDHLSFKSNNVDGKWTFKVHKVRHHNPFSMHSFSSSPTSTTSSATSAGYAVTSDIGDIRIVVSYSYESKQPRNSDFIIKPFIIHGSKEISLPAQKSTSPTIIQQKYYNTRGYQLNSNFLEYVYTFTWTNVIHPLSEIKNSLLNSKLQHYDTAHEEAKIDHDEANIRHEEASEEFFEEITKTDFAGHFGDITLKFVIQAYFPEEPVSVTSSRCNSSVLDLVVSSNLLEKLVASGKPNQDRTHGRFAGHGTPPYLRYANSMIYDDRFADVILVVGEGEVPAHRIILATSSPVFSAILENTTLPLSPSSSNTQNHTDCQTAPTPLLPRQQNLPRLHIEPSDIGLDCVEEFLRYIYTGSVDNLKMKDGHLANGLILLSDKYDLPELKRHCESILLQELTAENAIEMYLLGARVSSERMTRKALIVMKMNKVKLASQTEEFRELSMRHPTLMYELFLSD